ncbi:MAG: hypothetical protein QNJ51_24140 [Calothrix sp. MO_167.B12]|nr:hypothetical protein [Calothrix sp. MO_167.B12]
MAIKQVYGHIEPNGNIASGSGDFQVEKTEDGVYKIVLNPGFSTYPSVVVTQLSPYTTANAVINNLGFSEFNILTGFTDQSSVSYSDCQFSFIAMGEA